MAANNNLQDFLASVADAIRAKKGSTDLINPQSFATEIANLPSGGGAYIFIQSTAGATLTCGEQTYTLSSGETYHAFSVSLGTYVCSAIKGDFSKSETIIVTGNSVYYVDLTLSKLPRDFQEVEYLMSSGTQYINLAYSHNEDTYIDLTIILTGFPSKLWMGIFGSRTHWAASDSFDCVINTQTRTFGFNAAGRDIQNVLSAEIGRSYKIRMTGDLVQVDEGIITYTENLSSNQYHDVLLSVNENSNIPPDSGFSNFIGKVIYLKIMENGQTLRNFIPCYRKSDSKPGMYDLAGSICPLTNSPLYINAGTGEFIVGPDVN